ncbi:hypothetical protein [Treponema sp. J25]|uniref:hypothetical protein n=1 Tax=Treponema sp. J25 TaxID=2094121 RepID=UPI001047EFAF|nr:hypothetical protein [Treponema sp. J25]TCW61772.1 hypothetical protein C5O22_05160 [Treponema sp. J25]
MKVFVKSYVLVGIIVGTLVIGIGGAKALGWWITASQKVAKKITTGDFAGMSDPADLRGSYTFADMEKNYGVPVSVLAQAFGYTDVPDPSLIKAKDIEGRYGTMGDKEIGTDSVRLFVALYTGIPYTPKEESTGILDTAIKVLRDLSKLTDEQIAQLQPRLVVTQEQNTESPASASDPKVPETKTSDSGETGVPQKVPAATTNVDQTQPVAATKGTGSDGQSVSSTAVSNSQTQRTSPATEATHTPLPQTSSENLIRGKTTFAEVLAWGVSKAQIEQVLGKPMPPEQTVIRDWCLAEGLEFSTVRDALQKLKP